MSHPFDTVPGIEDYLGQGLAGLRMLVDDRRAFVKDHGPTLREWFVLGSFCLDGYGQVWHLKERVADAARVSDRDGIFRALHEDVSISQSPGHLPPAVDVCAWCRLGWTLGDAHDVVAQRADNEESWTYRHHECARLHDDVVIGRPLRRAITDGIATAGAYAEFPLYVIRPVPNLYPDRHGPWYRIGHNDRMIVIGWRRRVIQIDWSRGAIVIDGRELFADVAAERITVGERLVHAYGYEKATEYLCRLCAAVARSEADPGVP